MKYVEAYKAWRLHGANGGNKPWDEFCKEFVDKEREISRPLAEAKMTGELINLAKPTSCITTDKQARKEMPVARGLLGYFPLAACAVAHCSWVGNQQHNAGEPMHWAREKSTDHADCLIRHLMERGKRDSDGVRHAAKVAWRALALLQLEIEADGGAI